MRAFFVALCVLMLATLAAAGQVQHLTPETFDDVVMDPTKTVMTAFTAPWCGHCVRMAPAYDELAAMQESDDVVIAKVDADKYPELAQKHGVRGFPTVKLFKKDDKSGMPFQGARDAQSFNTFIQANL